MRFARLPTPTNAGAPFAERKATMRSESLRVKHGDTCAASQIGRAISRSDSDNSCNESNSASARLDAVADDGVGVLADCGSRLGSEAFELGRVRGGSSEERADDFGLVRNLVLVAPGGIAGPLGDIRRK